MRIDWIAARRYYVEGYLDPETQRHVFPTLEEVAAKFGASVSAVRHRAAAERWTEQRTQFLHAIAQRSQEEAARRIAEEIGETQVTLAVRAFRRFLEIEEAASSLLSESLGPRNLKVLAETLKTCFEQQRLILGMTLERTALDVKVTDWRVELAEALKRRWISADEVRKALGEDAEELLKQAGI